MARVGIVLFAARLLGGFALVCFLVSTAPSVAATFEWRVGADGEYDDPDDWELVSGSGSPPPGVGDTAEFNLPAVFEVGMQSEIVGKTWDLDKILVTGGVVTIAANHLFNNVTETSAINLTTGEADIEVDGGHLIIDENTAGSGDSLTVTVGDDLLIREGIFELRDTTTLTVPALHLGQQNSKTSELFIDDGATLNVTAPFTNRIGVNAAQGTLHVLDGHATLAGTTLLGDSISPLSHGVINVSSIDSIFADTVLTLESLALGGEGGTGELNARVRSDTHLTGASTLTIGGSGGAGTVNLEDQALIDTGTGDIALNATGELNISGGTFQADGFLDFQGGTLNMTGGELVINDGMDAITGGGAFSLNGGVVRVQNGLARLETSLNFGGGATFNERAEVIVEDGNAAEVQFAFRIGYDADSYGRAQIVGEGSTLTGTGGGAGADLIVGVAGEGHLWVSAGASATFRDDFVIAEQAGSVGNATVRSAATVDVTAGSGAVVSVGPAGTGVLEIHNAASVQAGGDIYLASQPTGDAAVFVEQGSCFPEACSMSDALLRSGDDLMVGGGSSSAGGTAVLTVDEGGRVVVPDVMRIYGGGSVQFDGGRIEVGALEFQGGGGWEFGGVSVPGTLHFTGDETFDASLVAGLSGTTGTHNRGLIELVGTLTVTAPFTIAGADLTAGALVADAPIIVDDPFAPSSDVVITGAATVSQQFTQNNSNVTIDDLALAAPYTLTGGKLSLRTGSNLPPHFDFQGGLLELTGAELVVGPGGLLGDVVDLGAGRTVENLGGTVVTSGGQLQISGGVYDAAGAVAVQDGGALNSQSTLRLRHNLSVEAGGAFSNVGIVTLLGPAGRTVSGIIDNHATIVLDTSEVAVPASGLTLSGGGELVVDANAALNGASVGVVNNVDNRLEGNPTHRLELRDLQLQMGPSAVVGGAVDLIGVDMVGGGIDAPLETTLSSSTTLDGVVHVGGSVNIHGARVLPTGDVRLQAGALLTIGPTTLDLDGRLRAEAGANVNLAAPGVYDWTGGAVSLADDSSHAIDPGAAVTLSTPLRFDNLTVDNASFGFMNAVFGAEPVIGAGQALDVGGVTTLDSILTVDGGAFATAFLENYENLDLRSGEFHLGVDNFVVGAGGAGPNFHVGGGATLSVHEQISITTGSRLVVAGGEANAGGFSSGVSLSNDGDLDVVDGAAEFSQAAVNSGDINAIDSVLTFSGGLDNPGRLNLIDSTVVGAVVNSGGAALAGANMFAGDVSGGGDFVGDGAVLFESTYSPGEGPAEISFGGDVQFGEFSTLAVEIGGVAAGTQFDALRIAGAAALAGTLDVELVDLGAGEFAPSHGDAFEILSADAGVSGAFSTTPDQLPALGGDLRWEIQYGPQNVVLAIAGDFAGDYNDDGVVDAADYVVWRDHLGAPAGTLPNDVDGGAIGAAQYATWRASHGATLAPVGQGGAPAPAPSGLTLLCVGALGLCAQASHGRWSRRRATALARPLTAPAILAAPA